MKKTKNHVGVVVVSMLLSGVIKMANRGSDVKIVVFILAGRTRLLNSLTVFHGLRNGC